MKNVISNKCRDTQLIELINDLYEESQSLGFITNTAEIPKEIAKELDRVAGVLRGLYLILEKATITIDQKTFDVYFEKIIKHRHENWQVI
ncbi:MAG TPA: hypothetical protein PK125_13355 [Syntrophorhabdus sp.]|jgi:hypothetical protein|nr:MAG: hypothetical protein A4E59_02611 [Syntrophorhabdus sp. PtaB.Bin027]OQB77655.1 MAG: hypothetical protein BWX92_00752 [Deltaproteobacteria bacterium ADurb.Bin135]HPB39131.1 hypothetical protein [Syntrophorhabdus sp.]